MDEDKDETFLTGSIRSTTSVNDKKIFIVFYKVPKEIFECV